MSKLLKSYTDGIEKYASRLLESNQDHIMDIILKDRESFKKIGYDSTGTVAGWTASTYEYLTVCFLKKGLEHLLDNEWKVTEPSGLEEEAGERNKHVGSIGGKKIEILPNMLLYKQYGLESRVKPDITVRYGGKIIVLIEVKSSLSDERKRFQKELQRLLKYEEGLPTRRNRIYAIVLYAGKWSMKSTRTDFDRPKKFMLVTSTNLRNTDLMDEKIMDMRDLIESIKKIILK